MLKKNVNYQFYEGKENKLTLTTHMPLGHLSQGSNK